MKKEKGFHENRIPVGIEGRSDSPKISRTTDAGNDYTDQYDVNDPLYHITEGY